VGRKHWQLETGALAVLVAVVAFSQVLMALVTHHQPHPAKETTAETQMEIQAVVVAAQVRLVPLEQMQALVATAAQVQHLQSQAHL
jgi:hypothetical protein